MNDYKCNIYKCIYLDFKNGWQIMSPRKSFAVYAATPVEKAEWMAHINKCINDLLKKSMSLTFPKLSFALSMSLRLYGLEYNLSKQPQI